jgi:hypothetical protein
MMLAVGLLPGVLDKLAPATDQRPGGCAGR